MRLNERVFGGFLVLFGLAGLGWSWLWPAGDSVIFSASPMPSLAQGEAAENETSARIPCRVLTVYDGDTVGCDLNGNGRVDRPREQVRFLGIDTPEMHYSRKNPTHGTTHAVDEPFAADASQYVVEQAQGKLLYLEFDAQREDPYGRTLAYTYLTPEGGISIGEELLSRGYATVMTFKPNTRFQRHYEAVEAEARRQGRGLWATN